jgi:hypothetical protein
VVSVFVVVESVVVESVVEDVLTVVAVHYQIT